MNFWENLTPLDLSHLEVFLGIFHFLNLNLNFEFRPIWYRSKSEPGRTGSHRFGVVLRTYSIACPYSHTKSYLKRKDRLSQSRKKRIQLKLDLQPQKIKRVLLLVNWWRIWIYLAKCCVWAFCLGTCYTNIFADSQVHHTASVLRTNVFVVYWKSAIFFELVDSSVIQLSDLNPQGQQWSLFSNLSWISIITYFSNKFMICTQENAIPFAHDVIIWPEYQTIWTSHQIAEKTLYTLVHWRTRNKIAI